MNIGKIVLGALVAAAGMTAFAAPSVKINKVETANPWDGRKGTIKVDYSLVGIDAETKYKVVFDVTADGKTASVTNGWAILSEGQQSQKEIDTAKLFGGETVAKDAEVKISLIVELGGVQLWEGGPFFAECNVGATKPEEYGYYFWWGDTVGYKFEGVMKRWVSVKDATQTIQFASNDPTAGQTYNKDADTLKSEGWTDDSGNLVVSDVATENHDAARAHLGSPWRMMTDAELQKLVNDCERKWVEEYNGKSVKGYVVSGEKGSAYENNEVFFPAAGYGIESDLNGTGLVGHYRSSTPATSSSKHAQNLYFTQYTFYRFSDIRYDGYVVRPVRGSAEEPSQGAAEKTVVVTAEADFWLGPGCESCPWAIGEGVTAYIKELGLYLKGAGELADELADCAPWAPYVDELDGAYLPRAVKVPASVAATLPISVAGVAAPSGVTVNGVDVRTGFSEDWMYDPKTHTVEIVKPGSYVLSGSNTEGKVMFAINADAEVTLSNLCLRCMTAKECCIRATNDVSVTLFLAGVNTLDAFDGNNEMGEGLRIENDSHLTIAAAPGFADEDAVLIAKGGYKHAAIAVRRHGTEGGRPSLAIAGGTVYANWFESPARRSTGIGANSDFLIGCNMNCDADIAITGGRVFARGGYHVPGIGGTHYLAFGAPDILITGGYVEAEGGEEASGIGGGYQGKCGSVTITGGTIRAKGQGTYADIGTHFDFVKDAAVTLTGGSIWMANRSHVEPWPPPSNGTERVWCATVQVNVEGGGKWEGPLAIDGLEGYGTKDIVAVQGEVYLWLSNGKHTFIVGGKGCTVDVNGKKTVPVSVSIPPVEPPPGTVDNPWIVGKDVQAYTNERGELTITGTGAMDDFATAADIPWDPAGVTEVTIGAGVTKIGANAWAGMNDSVVINGAALPVIRLTASGLDSAGSTLPEGMIAVSKTELEAAGAATLTIVDGTAYLGVSVKTNGDLKAEQKSWGKVRFDKGVKVDVSEDGTELVIPVPANAEQGFMVLESGESK